MSLKIDIRRNKILQQLRAEGIVSVSQLSEALDATTVTIRSDLTALEEEGYLVRVQGGAVLPSRAPGATQIPNGIHMTCQTEKEAIASAVAELIRDGSTLFINSGTTTECIARALCSKSNLNVVTNSLAVATCLGDVPSIRVVLLGGEINAQYGFTYGGDAQEQLSRYQADWVILSCEGISQQNGITTHHVEESIIDRLMMGGAKQVLLAADHRKLGHVGFAQVCQCKEPFRLVTDKKADEEEIQALSDCGIRIIQA